MKNQNTCEHDNLTRVCADCDLDLGIVRNPKHQGWTNYETWRVNLEIFDGVDWNEWYGEDEQAHDFSEFVESLKEYAEQAVMIDDSVNTLANDYANAFLQEVNYNEIAESIITNYPKLLEVQNV